MKHWIVFGLIVAAGVAGVIFAQRSRADVSASPAPIFYIVADAERDLMRLPVSLAPLSDSEEIAIGNRLTKNGPPLDERTAEDKLIADYISETGASIARHGHRKLPWKFHYIPDDNLINAFALPGGHVFIGRGLLDLMDTEDELAAILGHEIEHVELRHCAERVQIQERVQRLPLGELTSIPFEIFEAGYSKEQELDADREGTALAVTAGYSPSGAVSMFRKLEKLEAELDAQRSKPQRPDILTLPIQAGNVVIWKSVEEYFRSHPPTDLRRVRVERLIADKQWRATPQRPMRAAYLLRRDRAARLLAAGQVDKAKTVAEEALSLNPNYPPALDLAAEIDFEQAGFQRAAERFERSLGIDPNQPTTASQFAMALEAYLTPSVAADRFEQWMEHFASSNTADQIHAERAGLRLLAGDPEPTRSLARQLAGSADKDAPYAQSRLGWWEYRAGELQVAADLTEASLELHPQASEIELQLGWILVAERKFATARQRFAHVRDSGTNGFSDAQVGLAVVTWETDESRPTAALMYSNAVSRSKAWENRSWVKGVYGPAVESMLAPIRTEYARLKKLREKARP